VPEVVVANVCVDVVRPPNDVMPMADDVTYPASFEKKPTFDGIVKKIADFGLFVELDPEIHGLAHISELSDDSINDINNFVKVGDIMDFEVVSIEPSAHRLGLRTAGTKPVKSDDVKSEDSVEEKESEQTESEALGAPEVEEEINKEEPEEENK